MTRRYGYVQGAVLHALGARLPGAPGAAVNRGGAPACTNGCGRWKPSDAAAGARPRDGLPSGRLWRVRAAEFVNNGGERMCPVKGRAATTWTLNRNRLVDRRGTDPPWSS